MERRAFRIARFGVSNDDDALDVVQEAMISLATKYADRDEAEWTPLFYRILQNKLRDAQRKSSVRGRLFGWLGNRKDDEAETDRIAEQPDPSMATPERSMSEQDALSALETALSELPARQREAFLYRHWEGLDVAATANAMGCSEGSVKTHTSRAIAALRSQVDLHWENNRQPLLAVATA